MGSVTLRRAGAPDADAVAAVWPRSFATALPTVRRVHPDDAVRAWFRRTVVPRGDTWPAETRAVGTGESPAGRTAGGRTVVGMMTLGGDELEQLHLDPSGRGRGLGDRFVTLAQDLRPAGLELWTFQVSTPARRFCESHGFRRTERTGGARNEEREPDVRYVWTP